MVQMPPRELSSSLRAHEPHRPHSGWLRRWWPVLFWAAIISIFSTHYFGSDETSAFIIPLLHWMFPSASQATLLEWHHLIRKSAHFVEYFVLSLLLLRAIRGERREMHLAWALAAIALVGGYAALDEIHQIFVPGRTPAVRDVLIDTTGGIAAQAIIALLAFWKGPRELAGRTKMGD